MTRRQGDFIGWYINLQRPLVRSALGFDTLDQTLDLIIRPDLVAHHWKDEDEFAEDVRHGIFSAEEASAIRAEGERVLQKARRGESPFRDGWDVWQPDGSWSVPSLPEGWDRP
jgi:predicted RNA-binding protein associated with RNAse of E/G family